jgi:hypothetical protein
MVLIIGIISVNIPITLVSFPVRDHVNLVYDKIDSLQPGDYVIFSGDTNAAFYAEFYSGMFATAKHVASKPGVKIIFVGFWEDGPLILNLVLDQIMPILEAEGKVYGEDYVELGFVAGYESGYAAFCEDLHKTLKTDYYGTSLEDLSIMDDISNAYDIALWINSGLPGTPMIMRQFAAKYEKGDSLVVIGNMSYIARMPIYQQAGTLLASLNGPPDGAAYEQLIEQPGVGGLTLNALTLLPAFTIVILIVGNAIELTKGKEEGD